MNISNDTSAHELRIILTRTVHGIDMVTQFNQYVLDNLLNVSDKLMDVLLVEKAVMTTPIMKEFVDVDIETLKMNMRTLSSAIRLNKFKFEFELNMN